MLGFGVDGFRAELACFLREVPATMPGDCLSMLLKLAPSKA